ncbi:NepR family anti-sigma factor [Methylobacterium sp. sgz302541]|uniref:NepR family anti-sigma factor n=1 Tax=unclassified Methylobacterium TaxID=2615210 RepID=UPI003D326C07
MTRTDDETHRQAAGDPCARSARRLDADARRRIGQGLRLHYASLVAQPLPERFTALLAELAASAKPEEPSR